mgnify:CR=1 FL=1
MSVAAVSGQCVAGGAPRKDSHALDTGEMFVKRADSHCLLRPETVESLFYMWRFTKDPKYREWGWKAFLGFEKYTKVATGGYSGIKNVNSENSPKDDTMQTFWLAETLKYFYLIFADADVVHLDEWVFNTAAHPLRLHRACACRSVRSLPRALFSRSVRGRNDLRLTMHGRRVRALLVSRGMRSDVQCTDVGPACSLCVRIEQYGGVTPRCPRFVFRSLHSPGLVRRGCRVSLGCGCGTALSIGAVRIGFLCVVSLTLGVVGAGSPGECHAGARSSSQFDLCTVRPARHRLWGEAASFSLSSYCRYSSTHTHTHLQYSV